MEQIQNTQTMEIIVATNSQGHIAHQCYGEWTIPWPYIHRDALLLREKMAAEKTVVIVGRGTWDSLSSKLLGSVPHVRILSRRYTADGQEGLYYPTLESALEDLPQGYHPLVIGGGEVYAEAMLLSVPKRLYWTVVDYPTPDYSDVQKVSIFSVQGAEKYISSALVEEKTHTVPVYDFTYTMRVYQLEGSTRLTHEHYLTLPGSVPVVSRNSDPWLSLLDRTWNRGALVPGRNGVTRSLFCPPPLRYDLRLGFPLHVAKRGYPKAVFEEAIWMLSGSTDADALACRGVAVWKANSSLQALQARGLDWEEGDIGPGYGFTLRHYGATYRGRDADYTGQGVDQVRELVDGIRRDPYSRRHLLNLWDPSSTDQCALPPCHVMYQFTVRQEEGITYLDCHLFQRSWDILLGWNTTTAAFWTLLIAACTGLTPRHVVHTVTDAHCYEEHEDAIESLLLRQSRPLPMVKVNRERQYPWEYNWKDLSLVDYHPLPAVRAEMVV